MTPERYAKLTEALNNRQPDLTLVTDEVHKDRNLSAIIRNCEAVGIHEIHSVVPAGHYRPFRGTARGAWRWVKLNVHKTISEPLAQLKSNNYQLVAAHLCDTAVDFRDIDYTRPTAIIMGNEKQGLSREAADYIDHAITIPMRGMVESFNVSVASGIILAEAQRQRELAELYGSNRLTPSEYEKTFFEWAHPQLAKFCYDKRLPYPPLDEEGEVIDGPDWYKQVRAQLAARQHQR
ncbi:MAG: tRNA (guanosine(18)-2'-O)-methyltransferase TrmH [Pseudomonadales bacterium]|nr:tRNA (guanosine(18)-2'-O)-methyltransferase TrmH [Pseudomonadales bacterium]